MKRVGVVYILASRKGGTLYNGVTTDLPRRIEEHRLGVGSKFTSKYRVMRLVWFEEFDLIEEQNPNWQDLRWQLF